MSETEIFADGHERLCESSRHPPVRGAGSHSCVQSLGYRGTCDASGRKRHDEEPHRRFGGVVDGDVIEFGWELGANWFAVDDAKGQR
jgi:hypothetical protein